MPWDRRPGPGWANAKSNPDGRLRIDGAEQVTGVEGEVHAKRVDGGDAEEERQRFEDLPPRVGMPEGLRLRGTDGPAPDVRSSEGAERRVSVTSVMSGGVVPGRNDMEVSARTPVGGW